MPGVVIELKAADEETEDLDALAREARRQIGLLQEEPRRLQGPSQMIDLAVR